MRTIRLTKNDPTEVPLKHVAVLVLGCTFPAVGLVLAVSGLRILGAVAMSLAVPPLIICTWYLDPRARRKRGHLPTEESKPPER